MGLSISMIGILPNQNHLHFIKWSLLPGHSKQALREETRALSPFAIDKLHQVFEVGFFNLFLKDAPRSRKGECLQVHAKDDTFSPDEKTSCDQRSRDHRPCL